MIAVSGMKKNSAALRENPIVETMRMQNFVKNVTTQNHMNKPDTPKQPRFRPHILTTYNERDKFTAHQRPSW